MTRHSREAVATGEAWLHTKRGALVVADFLRNAWSLFSAATAEATITISDDDGY